MPSIIQWLIIGLITAVISVPLVRWFWKLYDRPTPEMLEQQRFEKEQDAESRIWLRMENELRIERQKKESWEKKQRNKAIAAARAKPLDAASASAAWTALGINDIAELSKSSQIPPMIDLPLLETIDEGDSGDVSSQAD